jgi:hypothetical protein
VSAGRRGPGGRSPGPDRGGGTTPATPTVHGALQDAAVDLYHSSWHFFGGNLAWSATLIAVVLLAVVWLPLAAGMIVLAVPTAGLSRMACVSVRGDDARFSDFVEGCRLHTLDAVIVGAAAFAGVTTCVALVVWGGLRGDDVGLVVAVVGVVLLLPVTVLTLVTWPLLTDPGAGGRDLGEILRLALRVTAVRPASLLGLTAALVSVTAFTAALTVLLLLVGVAYVCLAAAHYVLPWADLIEPSGST